MKETLFFPYPINDEKNNSVNIDAVRNIYEHMADDLSRQIFINRLNFSITQDFGYIRNIVLTNSKGGVLQKILQTKQPVYIYGAGIRGERIGRIFPDIRWQGYIDCKKEGECNGRKIYRLHEVNEREKAVVLVSMHKEADDVKEQLISCGFLAENVIVLNDFDNWLAQEQYFEDFLEIKHGTMIDAGAYHGEDVIKYMDFIKDDTCRFLAFEPDAHSFELCKNQLKEYKNGTVYNMGLGAAESVLRFDSRGDVDSSFSEDGTDEIKIVALDSFDEAVSFLKADVEGAELELLKGAANTIKKYKPDIAICVYHKKDDVWVLPQMLLDLNPNYKFYMRHYSIETVETVLYAVNVE